MEEAVRTRAVERRRGAAPGPAPALRAPGAGRPRPGTGGGFGRGFRTGLLLSLAAHVLLGALFARDLLAGKSAAPPPVLVSTGLDLGPLLDPDPEPLEVNPPEVAPPRAPPADLVEDLPEPMDPRLSVPLEPPGPLAAVIGVQAADGRRRGVPGGGGGGGGRVGRARAVPAGEAARPGVPPPPAPEPAFETARLRADAAPIYPARALERGVEGSVYLRIEVSAEGSVAGVAVERSSGTPSLDEAAVRAAGAWLFDPATEGGRPVPSTVRRWVHFHL